jgi:hydroxymethylbilane synthase
MSQNQFPLRLGTRGSRLALAQADTVRARLAASGIPCEIVVVKTTGDRIQDRPLADAGGKGLFTKELELALSAREIDFAVHSMKDVPVKIPEGLAIGAILAREDPRDAFISKVAASLETLPKTARVGTSSVRRQAQVARARPDIEVVLLRGNVDTRLEKLLAGQYDAIVLAYAGLKRLGLESHATSLFSLEKWLPALAQGAVGVEIRADDGRTASAVSSLKDRTTEIALSCERAFQAALDGSCRTPIAGIATVVENRLSFRGEVLAPDGKDFADTAFDIDLGDDAVAEAAEAGRAAGLALKPRAAGWLVL